MLEQKFTDNNTNLPLDQIDPKELSSQFESLDASGILEWAINAFPRKLGICTSFQSEGLVILDLATKISKNLRVFTIDTGRLPQETLNLIDRIRDKYQIPIEVYFPDSSELNEMATEHGVNPFYNSVSLRLLCCNIRKVIPLNKALKEYDAWITGLRRSQGETRHKTGKVEIDSAHGNIIKINPLADWSYDQVWDYIHTNDIPYNELYDQGYTSIGCAPCTRPVESGEDIRAGRWWWESGMPKECGIHLGSAWTRNS
jgi:phosphoadenosine phosphosulfate reductase